MTNSIATVAHTPERRGTLGIYLLIALFALALAATTGVLLRFGLIYGMPAWAQNYGAVRHAHSHLMYFGWVTLALMVIIWAELPGLTGRSLPRAARWQLGLTALMALLSFPAFWANGYGLTQIGSARLPLGSMVATFNGLTWFLFVFLYARMTWRLPVRALPVQLWDWAIVLLLLAALGAVGLVAMIVTGAENPFLQQMFLHQFLDLFAVGWFNLALLGVIWAKVGRQAALPPRLPVASLALLLAPSFFLGMSPGLLTPALFWLAALCNAGAAVLLGVHLWQLWRRRSCLPRVAWLGLAALGVSVVTAFVLLTPGFWAWSAGGQLRIFYLHNLLLGWVSTLLVGLLLTDWIPLAGGVRWAISWLWGIGVVVMLGALLGMGFAALLPAPPVLWLQMAAWASVLVAAAAILLFVAAVGQALTRRSRAEVQAARA